MTDAPVIEGIKLIRHNASGVNEEDDPSFPYKLEASFRPPGFMAFTFIALHGGSEEIVVRGMTREALEQFVELNHLNGHARLTKLTITGPDDESAEGEANDMADDPSGQSRRR